jgi:Kef-type K+ transport system membrane component KefB
MKKTSNFYIQTSIISGILAFIIIILGLFVPSYYAAADFISIAILWTSTMAFYRIVVKNYSPERPSSFVNIFMSATMAKLFILLVYIMIYIFSSGKSKVQFLSFLLIAYGIYTFLEVKFLIKHQKKSE